MMPLSVTKEIPSEQEMYIPQETYYPQSQQAPQEGYEYQYPPTYIGDTDTIIEIAEQVFLEKNKPIQKKLDEINEFRALAQTKIDNISDRLKRIELIIDKLQASILEKIGSYGQGLETIKKEMGMMQESFGKMINQIAEAAETKQEVHRLRQSQNTENFQENTKDHITVHKSKKITKKHYSKK
jgi:hypothetical protein